MNEHEAKIVYDELYNVLIVSVPAQTDVWKTGEKNKS
jgi:hypothetical protein